MGVVFVLFFLFYFSDAQSECNITASYLRCESQVNPHGIDVTVPRLSWIPVTVQQNCKSKFQTAFRILVSSNITMLDANDGDIWDTGIVYSSQTISIEYNGYPLKSDSHYYWKVFLWDEINNMGPADEIGSWHTALLYEEDWQGVWIQRNDTLNRSHDCDLYQEIPVPIMRKEFFLSDSVIKYAYAHVTGLGYYELYINGRKIGDHVLDPGWTQYNRTTFYSSYNVSSYLIPSSKNVIGIMLGNGWYNPLPLRFWGGLNLRDYLVIGDPKCILQLNIVYEDLTRYNLSTDPSWKAGNGSIIKNNIYLGEVHDNNLFMNWFDLDFDDSSWPNAIQTESPKGKLRAQYAPPIKMKETIQAVEITQPTPGVYIFDMGVNFAGWIQITLNGKGLKYVPVHLRYGEILSENGTLNGLTSVAGQIKSGDGGPCAPRIAYQQDVFILRGDSVEVFQNKFTWHGFRYVELSNYPGVPTIDSIIGIRLGSDLRRIGEFISSNDLFNQIHQMVHNTFQSNIFSIQSDCPHRERFGYGGDALATLGMTFMNYDMENFDRKRVNDFFESARSNYGITECAPYNGLASSGMGDDTGPIGWGSIYTEMQYSLYRYTGDYRTLYDYYLSTRNWTFFLEIFAANNSDTIDIGLGDWDPVETTPTEATSNLFYYINLDITSKIAKLVGEDNDAIHFSDHAKKILNAYNNRFLAGNGSYSVGSQCAQSFPLFLGIVPQTYLDIVIGRLLLAIEEANFHITTGCFGIKYLLESLSNIGLVDLAYAMINQKTYPGYGYMLSRGATTLWEVWFYNNNTFSHNHPMFGAVDEWFFNTVAGIDQSPISVAFDDIVIFPQPGLGTSWAKGRYNSPRGLIISEWTLDTNHMCVNVTIPVNTKATIIIPSVQGCYNVPTKNTVGSGNYFECVQCVTEITEKDK